MTPPLLQTIPSSPRKPEQKPRERRWRMLHVLPHASTNVFFNAFWEYLPSERYEVEFVTLEPPATFHRDLAVHGIGAWSLQTHSSHQGVGKALWRLRSFFTTHHYDLVHLHGFPTLAAAWPAVHASGASAVIYTHHYGRELLLYPPPQGVVSRWIERTVVPRFDRVVAISEDVADYLGDVLRLPPQRVVTIRYGFDFPRERLGSSDREALKDRWGLRNSFVIGCVGRLHWTKGQRYLLEAMAQACQGGCGPLRLLLLGEGPERHALERDARSLGLASVVEFLGRRREIWDWYQVMDLLVHPSLQHGYEQVIVEAMAMGTPVVTTPVGIAREVVIPGLNGWFVPERDTVALSGMLSRLCRETVVIKRAGLAAAETVQQRIWSRKAMVDAYEQLYRSLFDQSDHQDGHPFS